MAQFEVDITYSIPSYYCTYHITARDLNLEVLRKTLDSTESTSKGIILFL